MNDVFIIGHMLENTERGPERRPVRINLRNVIYYKGTANNRTNVYMIGGRLLIEEPLDKVDEMIRNATTLPEPIPCKTASTDKWHNLAKHPNDLPPQSSTGVETVLAVDKYGTLWFAYCDCGKWFSDTGAPLRSIEKWRYID